MNMNTMHIVMLKNFQQTMSVDKKTHQACITYHLKKNCIWPFGIMTPILNMALCLGFAPQ